MIIWLIVLSVLLVLLAGGCILFMLWLALRLEDVSEEVSRLEQAVFPLGR